MGGYRAVDVVEGGGATLLCFKIGLWLGKPGCRSCVGGTGPVEVRLLVRFELADRGGEGSGKFGCRGLYFVGIVRRR
jgi:hypothetical protein